MKRKIAAAILIVVFTVAITAQAQAPPSKKSGKAKDPVCGLTVDKDPNLSANYKGETYYFCSKADMEKFRKQPEKYAKKK